MLLFNVLPAKASFFVFFLICIATVVIFHFTISKLKFIFLNPDKVMKGEPPKILMVISMFELIILCNLLVSMTVYYTEGKSLWLKVLYCFIAFGALMSEVTRYDRKMESKATSMVAMVYTLLFSVFIFWDGFREFIGFSFLFQLLK